MIARPLQAFELVGSIEEFFEENGLHDVDAPKDKGKKKMKMKKGAKRIFIIIVGGGGACKRHDMPDGSTVYVCGGNK